MSKIFLFSAKTLVDNFILWYNKDIVKKISHNQQEISYKKFFAKTKGGVKKNMAKKKAKKKVTKKVAKKKATKKKKK